MWYIIINFMAAALGAQRVRFIRFLPSPSSSNEEASSQKNCPSIDPIGRIKSHIVIHFKSKLATTGFQSATKFYEVKFLISFLLLHGTRHSWSLHGLSDLDRLCFKMIGAWDGMAQSLLGFKGSWPDEAKRRLTRGTLIRGKGSCESFTSYCASLIYHSQTATQ